MCTFSVPSSLSLFLKAWQLVKHFVFSLYTRRVGNLHFTSPDKERHRHTSEIFLWFHSRPPHLKEYSNKVITFLLVEYLAFNKNKQTNKTSVRHNK